MLRAGSTANLIAATPVFASTAAINVMVKSGGALINSNTFTAIILQPLLHHSSLGTTADGGLTKSGSGTLVLSSADTYTGTTTVTSGSLVINGAVASTLVVVTGSLGGSGTMANATLSGSGSINPGNSPGILTASATNPTGGLDYNFEFTAANIIPAWNNATASVNDVL